jgi:hypothetical protein
VIDHNNLGMPRRVDSDDEDFKPKKKKVKGAVKPKKQAGDAKSEGRKGKKVNERESVISAWAKRSGTGESVDGIEDVDVEVVSPQKEAYKLQTTSFGVDDGMDCCVVLVDLNRL